MTSTASATLKIKASRASGTACKTVNSLPKFETKTTSKASAESANTRKSAAAAEPQRYFLQAIYLDLTRSAHIFLKPYAKSKVSHTISFSHFVYVDKFLVT